MQITYTYDDVNSATLHPQRNPPLAKFTVTVSCSFLCIKGVKLTMSLQMVVLVI